MWGDPWWEFPLFLALCAGLVGLWYWRRWSWRQELKRLIARYEVRGTCGLVHLLFWRSESLEPLEAEYQLARAVFAAACEAWPAILEKRMGRGSGFQIWFVRSPDQRVGWRSWRGIRWWEIPEYAGIPETSTGQGYGGMHESSGRSSILYVATFHEGRNPLHLLAHEMVHAVWNLHGHGEEFTRREAALRAYLGA